MKGSGEREGEGDQSLSSQWSPAVTSQSLLKHQPAGFSLSQTTDGWIITLRGDSGLGQGWVRAGSGLGHNYNETFE